MHWLIAWSVRGAGNVVRRPFKALLSTGRLGGGGLREVGIIGCW